MTQIKYGPSTSSKLILIILLIPFFMFISFLSIQYHEYEPHNETSSHHHQDSNNNLFQQHSKTPFPWFNPYFSLDDRIDQLLGVTDIHEKLTMLQYEHSGLPRLGIPPINWRTYGTHGLAYFGKSSVYPHPIALAATFNPLLIEKMAHAIRQEVLRIGHRHNIFAPNSNLFIDPYWGRGSETFGEDPLLASEMIKSVVKGLQGSDKDKINIAAACKHFLAFTENLNQQINIPEVDLYQTHMIPFQACINDAGAAIVLCSQNIINGHPMCLSPWLKNIVRDQLNFDGIIISDCNALSNAVENQKYVTDLSIVAEKALTSGIDIACSHIYKRYLPKLLETKKELLTYVDMSSTRISKLMIKLHLLDAQKRYPTNIFTKKEKQELALQLASQSIVLLKNAGSYLPLSFQDPLARWDPSDWESAPPSEPTSTIVNTIALIGPNIDNFRSLVGTENGCQEGVNNKVIGQACNLVTPLLGISQFVNKFRNVHLFSSTGSTNHTYASENDLDEAVNAAAQADVSIVVVGLLSCNKGHHPSEQCLEGESYDRQSIKLPDSQIQLIKTLIRKTTSPIILVVMSGSPIDISEFIVQPNVPSILQVFYPGEQGGTALSNILFGQTMPSGRLPFSIPLNDQQIPPRKDLNMQAGNGRTYRYMKTPPLFVFGYGLSYTKFKYELVSKPKNISPNSNLEFIIKITNVGQWPGEDILQLYVAPPEALNRPKYELKAFTRVSLFPLVSKQVSLQFHSSTLKYFQTGTMATAPGQYTFFISDDGPPIFGDYLHIDRQIIKETLSTA